MCERISNQTKIKHDLDKNTALAARAAVYNHYAKTPHFKPSYPTSSGMNTDSGSCGASSGFHEDSYDTFNATFDTTFDTTYDDYGTYESIDQGLYLQSIDEHDIVGNSIQDCSTPRQPEYVNDSSEIKSHDQISENPSENFLERSSTKCSENHDSYQEPPQIDQPKPVPRKSLSAVFANPDKMRSLSEELNERFAKTLQKSQSESALKVGNQASKFTHRVLHNFEADQYCATYSLDESDAEKYLTVKKDEMVLSDGIETDRWVEVTNEFGKTGTIPFSYIEPITAPEE